MLSWTLEAPARFNFPLTNTAGGPLDVSSVDIHFSCQSPDEPYIVKVDDGTSAGIPAGVSHDFPGVIAMNVSS